MKRVVYLLTAIVLFLISCEKKAALMKPESIAIDDKFMYVSNVNGPPTEVDHNGFISKLYHDGRVHTTKFIQKLNAPKGMVIVDGILYVTDIDRVYGFELKNGKPVFECKLVDKCQFLNDIAYDGKDHLYVSATDINEIFEINIKNKSLRMLGLGNQLNGPNGLWYYDNTLYVCEWGSDSVKGTVKSIAMNGDSLTASLVCDYGGKLDGIAMHDNKLYFSDWVTKEIEGQSKLLYWDIAAKKVEQVKSEPMTGCADFYVDAKNKQLIVPVMLQHKVIFVPL